MSNANVFIVFSCSLASDPHSDVARQKIVDNHLQLLLTSVLNRLNKGTGESDIDYCLVEGACMSQPSVIYSLDVVLDLVIPILDRVFYYQIFVFVIFNMHDLLYLLVEWIRSLVS